MSSPQMMTMLGFLVWAQSLEGKAPNTRAVANPRTTMRKPRRLDISSRPLIQGGDRGDCPVKRPAGFKSPRERISGQYIDQLVVFTGDRPDSIRQWETAEFVSKPPFPW